MLPFMKKDRPIGASTSVMRQPDGSMESDEQDPSDSDGLEACMTDFIRAQNTKDTAGMAAAFRSAFEILESQPHDEVEHEQK